jgi:hypothetical protein
LGIAAGSAVVALILALVVRAEKEAFRKAET